MGFEAVKSQINSSELSIPGPAVRRRGAPIRSHHPRRTAMEYMILIYSDESAFGRIGEAQLKAMYAEYGAYTQELMKAGVMRAGSELKPASTPTTVPVPGRKVLSPHRPFPAPNPQLGSSYL